MSPQTFPNLLIAIFEILKLNLMLIFKFLAKIRFKSSRKSQIFDLELTEMDGQYFSDLSSMFTHL